MATLKKFRVKKDMGGYSYPYTHMDLIFDDENKNLTEKLEEINADINSLKLSSGTGDGSVILSDYATKEYVDNAVQNVTIDTSDLALKSEIPDVSGLASKSDIPDISGLALKTEIPTIPTKVSEFENDAGYMTGIPSNYVTEDMLQNKGYMTNIPEEYATKEYVQNQIAGALKIEQVTESQYNSMVTKDPNTLYIIIED